MEVPGGHQNKSIVMLYEFIGTALLILGVNWGTTMTTSKF